MCGISGIIFSEKSDIDDKSRVEKITSMSKSLFKRGPDYTGFYSDQNCNLAHNRLSIIDLSESGNQPMIYEDWVIIFNGEIYNFLELKTIIQNNNIELDGTSDTEIFLKLISLLGIEQAIKKTRGIFAACLYNKRNNEFYLIRDRMGEKPLFYCVFKNEIYFASNPAAIVLAIPEKKWTLNRECLWEYFKLGGIFSDKTLFNDIVRVDSAEIVHIKNLNITKKLYWKPTYRSDATEAVLISELNKSIRQKLISDAPVTLFLSGGVDSSYVASIARNISSVHLDSEESEYAEEVAKITGSKFLKVKPENFDIEKILLDYSKFSGEPTMAGFIPYVVSSAVSKNYKVAISSNGADELFFGYPRTPTPNINSNFFKKLKNNQKFNIHNQSFDDINQIKHIFRESNSFFIPHLQKKVLFDDLLNKELIKLDEKMPNSAKYRWLELMTYAKGDLNLTLDYSSMINSLEVRAPFLDHVVVELALSINDTEHICSQYGRKSILKKNLILNGIPEKIWQRNKLGFSLNKKYLSAILGLKDNAVKELASENLFHIKNAVGRDLEYLRSAALGFWAWKKIWIDSGIVSLEYA